jgi:hypothetical protein
VSVPLSFVDLDGFDLDTVDLLEIFLVVQTVSQDIPEVAERPFQPVCSGSLFSLFKSSCLAFTIFD